jgi:hypothetical protein
VRKSTFLIAFPLWPFGVAFYVENKLFLVEKSGFTVFFLLEMDKLQV